jgi:hypothetical protein
MTTYQISCELFTARVTVDRTGKIVSAAPICSKFINKDIGNLLRWATKFSPLQVYSLIDGQYQVAKP